jgi:lipopolysaccharide/colanic/teichoic acid biosynthesis glycosyltransferase
LIRFLHAYFPSRTVFLGMSEACLVTFAFVTAAVVRLGINDAAVMLNYEQGFVKIVVIAVVFIICMYYFDLYDSSILGNRREILTRLIQVVGIGALLLAILYYVDPSLELGRGIFTIGLSLVGLILLLWRRLFLVINSQSEFAERALLCGDGPLAVPLMREVESRPELGLRIVSQFVLTNHGITQTDPRSQAEGNSPSTTGDSKNRLTGRRTAGAGYCTKHFGFVAEMPNSSEGLNGIRRIGGIRELAQIADKERIHRIIVTMGDRRGMLPLEELLELKAHGVKINDGFDFYEATTGKMYLGSQVLSQLLFSKSFCVSRVMLFFKRVCSLLFSLVLCIPGLPLMGFVAVGIWLDSGRPILFRQRRVGKDGRVFTLYKFRSMELEGNVNGHGNGKVKPAQENDPRFTSVGRWIRRLRVDELPQLYNILRGDMDFVGPRPFMLEEEQELARQIPYYKQRWAVRPGATGWAQVHRPYCATLEDNQDKLAYDLFYLKNMSIGLDLLIVFQTVKILLCGRGAR